MMPECTFFATVAKAILGCEPCIRIGDGLLGSGPISEFTASSPEESGTSTDLFVMFGSDFVRPGLAPQGELQYWHRPYFRLFEERSDRRRTYICLYI